MYDSPPAILTMPIHTQLRDTFIGYSREKLLRQYWPRMQKAVEQLTPQQVWWRADESNNSVGNLLLHLNGNIRQWIISGLGGVPDTRRRDSEFAQREPLSPKQLLGQLESTLKEADRIIADLTPEQLVQRHKIQGYDVTALEAVYTVVEHFSLHLGQVIYVNKMLLKKDLGFYSYLKQSAAGKKP